MALDPAPEHRDRRVHVTARLTGAGLFSGRGKNGGREQCQVVLNSADTVIVAKEPNTAGCSSSPMLSQGSRAGRPSNLRPTQPDGCENGRGSTFGRSRRRRTPREERSLEAVGGFDDRVDRHADHDRWPPCRAPSERFWASQEAGSEPIRRGHSSLPDRPAYRPPRRRCMEGLGSRNDLMMRRTGHGSTSQKHVVHHGWPVRGSLEKTVVSDRDRAITGDYALARGRARV